PLQCLREGIEPPANSLINVCVQLAHRHLHICDAEPAASVHPCYSLAKHSQRVRAEPPGLHQTNGGTYRLRTEPTALMAGHRPRQEAQQTKVIVAGALVLLEPP